MGVSTNGVISFGFVFEDGFEFPWDAAQFEDDGIDGWWRHVHGYANPVANPYTPEGNRKPDIDRDDPRISAYHKHTIDWDDAHPLPVVLENYCSNECPMWMLTVPGVGEMARRGYPEKIGPELLTVTPEQVAALVDFCRKYGIETDGEPCWYLTSYWG